MAEVEETTRVVPGRRLGPAVFISLAFMALVIVVAVFAPFIAWHDPLEANLARRLRPPVWNDGGTWSNPFGTDSAGRDLLARMIFGVRLSLIIGLAAVAVGGLLGVTTGILSGYYDGRAAAFVFGRLADVQQAIPFVVLALAVAASLGGSFGNLIIILGVGSWLFYYRIVRGEVLAIREESYIDAARALGQSAPGILLRHILPNVFPSVIVIVTLFVPRLIMFAAALSFLGLGVQPPQAELGLMIAEGRGLIQQAWWLTVIPGCVLAGIVLSMNTLGDWLRERLDPMLRVRKD
jgi:peptide/nickel transport system permease protein